MTQDVNPRGTTTTLSSSDGNSFPGETVTFTAAVSSQGSSVVPTGSVTFRIDGGSDTVVSLNNTGRASFSTSTLSLGQHTITADYTNADGNFVDSSASPLTQNVASVATTTTLTSSDSKSFPGESVTFTATVSAPKGGTPTGSVTFRIDGGSDTVVSLNGTGKATLTTSTLSLGQHTITADYTSNSTVFTNSSATPLRQTVASVATTTTLTSSPTSPAPGQQVTFTATVSAPKGGTPTGSVTFRIDGGSDTVVSLNGGGQATLKTSTLSQGQHTISADYTSNSTVFANSSAPPLSVTVSQIVTTTRLTSSVRSPSPGQSETFTATVSASGAAPRPGRWPSGSTAAAPRWSVSTARGRPRSRPRTCPRVRTPSPPTISAPLPPTPTARRRCRSTSPSSTTRPAPAGGLAVVTVYNASGGVLGSFLPYGGSIGGVHVAVGDVNGDGYSDIVVAPASGVLPVEVFSGKDLSLLETFFPYGEFAQA